MIVSISTSLQIAEVKYNDKLPIYIYPGKEIELTIKYTPLVYGNNVAYILIKLNNGKGYFYKITVYGVDNEFELKPIVIKTNRLGYLESFPIYIRNPYIKQQLVVSSVQAQDKRVDIQYNCDNQTCTTQRTATIIQPNQKLAAFNVVFTLNSPDFIFSIIRIRFQHDSTITLPILIKAKHELVLPELIDFGMVNVEDGAHRIMLRAENFNEPIVINEILYKKSPNFVFHLFNLTQKPFVIPKSDKPSTIGYIGFHSPTFGFFDSKLYLVINPSKIIKIEIRARVTESFLVDNAVLIDVTKNSKQVNTFQIPLKDDLNKFGAVINTLSDNANIKSRILCSNEDKHCSLKSSMLQVTYNSLNSTLFPLKRYISLFVASSLLHIQLTFYDTSPICLYSEYVNNEDLMLLRKRCDEVDKVNLGYFGNGTKYMDLHLMNINPKAINVTKLALKNNSAYCCMEILVISNERKEDIFKKWEYGKITEFEDESVLILHPGAMSILRIHLSLTDCDKPRAMEITDGDSFSNMLSFYSGDLKININLEYIYRSGDFSFSPSRMRFEPGFPGTTQSKELWAISTFKVPLKILKSWTTDKRIEFQQIIEEVTNDSKSELAIVKFTPGNAPEEQHFANLKSRILSWYDNTISLGELKLWRDTQQIWDSISSAGGTLIDSELLIDTNIIQGIKLSIKAELTRPILVQDNELNFQLIQNGSNKEMTIQIYNPSTSPLMIQLFTADPSNANHKANLPLSFFPKGKTCLENYTAWTKKYDTTMQQIRSKRRLTAYTSFEEFAEDYCCYMGKYNASILYSQKYEELTDNDLSATLAKHCYSKSVTQAMQGNTMKKSAKVPKAKGIWNLVFKEVKQTNEVDEIVREDFRFPVKYSQSPLIIAPLTYLTVGPITYSPTTVGEHNGLIFIKNNLTILYPIKLKGESGIGTIEFIEETNTLLKFNRLINAIPKEHVILKNGTPSAEIEFRLTQGDLLVEKINNNTSWPSFLRKFAKYENYPYRVRKTHGRVFTIRNIGNIPLIVSKISIEDRGCNAYGIIIENCEGFILKPEESYKVRINYTTSLAISSSRHLLVFHTDSGVQTFDLVIRLPFSILTILQQIPLLEE